MCRTAITEYTYRRMNRLLSQYRYDYRFWRQLAVVLYTDIYTMNWTGRQRGVCINE